MPLKRGVTTVQKMFCGNVLGRGFFSRMLLRSLKTRIRIGRRNHDLLNSNCTWRMVICELEFFAALLAAIGRNDIGNFRFALGDELQSEQFSTCWTVAKITWLHWLIKNSVCHGSELNSLISNGRVRRVHQHPHRLRSSVRCT